MIALVLAILAVALGRRFVLVAGQSVDIVCFFFASFVTLFVIAPAARFMPLLAIIVAVIVVTVLIAMVHLAHLRFLFLLLLFSF